MQIADRQISLRAAAGRALIVALISISAWAEEPRPAEGGADLNTLVRASMRAERATTQAGKPVWVEFVLTNLSDNRLTMRVPELSLEASEFPEMGLPIDHVFSGRGFTGPRLEDEQGERRDSKFAMKPKDKVPTVKLAPHGSVGVRLDLAQYYPTISRPGKYNLIWEPYNGSITSQPLAITVLAERQATILTDFGKMIVRFHYDQAPEHVQNFIELVEQRFYDNLTFNRIIPGGLVQGGDQLGNRRGVRPDGKRLKAEFNSIPFELGTVGMARSSNDPDSASSQFFICLGRQPGFDGKQTAFGFLVGDESLATLRRIAAVPTEIHNGLADYPKKPVYIRAISLESVPTRERRVEPSPITPPASQPSLSFLGQETAAPAAPAVKPEPPSPALPGLRAQGRVGRRATTAPASQ
jgi:cyclophilin family peptidyl-prolyl cis-trans isomerase